MKILVAIRDTAGEILGDTQICIQTLEDALIKLSNHLFEKSVNKSSKSRAKHKFWHLTLSNFILTIILCEK